jgi:5-methylcytosine-specific restriction endonuclease McrA
MSATTILNQKVLVLNRNWYPISTTCVRSALSLLVQGSVKVICTETYTPLIFEEWISKQRTPAIRTTRLEIGVPEVLLALKYDRIPKKYIPFSRRNIYKRDGYRCQYCGKIQEEQCLTIDHVYPKSRGGVCSWENCVTACTLCNTQKGAKLAKEFHFRLKNSPHRPEWTPQSLLSGDYRESWLKFIK